MAIYNVIWEEDEVIYTILADSNSDARKKFNKMISIKERRVGIPDQEYAKHKY